MRVLMLGWEFPPFISGGLGTACHGLTDALRRRNARVLFVLPRAVRAASDNDPEEETEDLPGVEVAPIPSELNNPYHTSLLHPFAALTSSAPENKPLTELENPDRDSSLRVMGVGSEDGYDGDLVGKIRVFTDRCLRLARRELFDLIHAHDWMTFPAAEGIARFSGRPLVVHVHATEFDRSGEQISTPIYDIERRGMHAADRVVAVSRRTRAMIIERYGVTPDKVEVVHNGIELNGARSVEARTANARPTVLFLGRLTAQKGPEFFIRAAARVSAQVPDARFVVVGTGELMPVVVDLARELGIEQNVQFTGFLRGAELERAYRGADVYVMPSVSEPFGLTALEAVGHGVPVILSTSSGAAEVLARGALKVDYWDTELMAKMIVSILKYPGLADTLRRWGADEIQGLTWDRAADRCIGLYNELVSRQPLVCDRPPTVVVQDPAMCVAT